MDIAVREGGGVVCCLHGRHYVLRTGKQISTRLFLLEAQQVCPCTRPHPGMPNQGTARCTQITLGAVFRKHNVEKIVKGKKLHSGMRT